MSTNRDMIIKSEAFSNSILEYEKKVKDVNNTFDNIINIMNFENDIRIDFESGSQLFLITEK